ncbi:MAG: hypothetical protein US13_C0012G0019 [candidate division TM6 bacterium GW2011_GWE2_36_25]|nr:MAG: hypothetical protein US03_C0011G0019 [candidate division TM6 bacterium GW2011_GWF2_36_131]KKQ02641.1 MAG: hypothetical protein US13_C0012G0019 [candidate division TM6 bacterium GW2011_GWE2_36_25]KKQ17998.1 MAG: hypothetical protein US32_C0033G0011 [candidate division TM6 bacterium GW2011_GWA2_36_9]
MVSFHRGFNSFKWRKMHKKILALFLLFISIFSLNAGWRDLFSFFKQAPIVSTLTGTGILALGFYLYNRSLQSTSNYEINENDKELSSDNENVLIAPASITYVIFDRKDTGQIYAWTREHLKFHMYKLFKGRLQEVSLYETGDPFDQDLLTEAIESDSLEDVILSLTHAEKEKI